MADDWRQPSRTRAGARFLQRRAREAETWETRLLAVLIAIPVFELALVAGVLVASGGSTWYAFRWYSSLPLIFHLALAGLALGVALGWGMAGITALLGHLFWTHPPPEQNRWITVSLWLALVLPTAMLLLMWRA